MSGDLFISFIFSSLLDFRLQILGTKNPLYFLAFQTHCLKLTSISACENKENIFQEIFTPKKGKIKEV